MQCTQFIHCEYSTTMLWEQFFAVKSDTKSITTYNLHLATVSPCLVSEFN